LDWELQKLARADIESMLSGYACALLLERNLISNDELAKESLKTVVAWQFPPILGRWFEGLAQRNRYGPC